MAQRRWPFRLGPVSELPYRYEKLQRPDNIRLLELQPGERDSALRLRLYEHDSSISAAGEGTWEAISYVWGDPTDLVTITCNSRSLAITATLSNALRRIRYADRPRVLWADAICINQKDLEEKSAQIPLMANIYRNASQVLAYLGEDPEGYAFSTSLFIEKINGIFSEQAELEHDDVFIYYSLGTDDAYRKDQAGWAMLSHLTHLELFQRAWIIQELGLAQRTTLLWGHFRTTLHELIHCLEHVANTLPRICRKDKLRIDEITRPYNSYRSWLPENRSHAVNAPARPDFLQVLYATRDYLASNERDYLYAFLGHPSALLEDGSLIVTPDYSLETSRIFTDFATAWIRHSKSLRILSCVEHYVMSADDTIVTPQPSWAPLLQQEKLQSPIGMDQACDFNAAPLTDGCISIDSSEGLLKCRGLVVDTIEYYSDEILPEYFLEWEKSDSDPEYIHFVEELWDEMVLASSPPLTIYSETELLEAFSRTLMASLGRVDLSQIGGSTPILKEFYIRFVEHPDHPEHPLGKALESVQRSDDEDIEPLMTSAFAAGAKRKFFRTERGYFGLGPAVMGVGDSCCVLFGSTVPHILLQTPNKGRYKLLGEAYIHGLMNGEAMKMWKEGTLDLQEFEIM